MRNIDTIKDRVQKLINQANDQHGTPEGDAFMGRAVEIMARYGFDERDLTTPDADDEIISREFTFTGSYTQQQAQLLMQIAEALHCKAFATAARRSNRATSATLFGARRHLERISMLYALINPMMLTLAKRDDVVTYDNFGTSAVVRRRSFMIGFMTRLAERLREAEGTVADDSGQYAVALRDDAERASTAYEDYLAEIGATFRKPSRVRFDQSSADNGSAAADATDIGQTRVGKRPALTA